MNGGKPGELEPGINGGDFPAPIPWLTSVGKVRPLDVAEPSAPASPALIQIRRTRGATGLASATPTGKPASALASASSSTTAVFA